nr:hypothetical protein [Tanacetum cinerariifolium]
MSIYDFMTLPSWSDAKIVEESHQLPLPLLERVLLHTTAPTMEGVIISLPIPDEIVASLPDSRLVKNSKELDQAEGANQADLADLCAKIEDSLERDKGISMRDVSALTAHLGKRLGAPPSIAVVSASKPSYVGTLIPASTFGCSLSLGGVVASGRVGKSGAEVMQRQMDPLDCLTRSALARDAEYDKILGSDFGTVTRGEEIDLTRFPLALGPYHMPYLYESVSSPLNTKEEWDGPHTITPADLRRTESLLPLELSNRVNVLSALLVSHGYELNSRYTNLVSSKALLQEKLNQKKGMLGQENRELCSQRDAASEDVKKLQSQLADAKAVSAVLTEELTRTDAKLSVQALTVRDLDNEFALEKSKSQGYKDDMDALREEVAQFVDSSMEGVVRKLLSSDEFHAALARVASLGINYGAERGLRMGRTDVEFEASNELVWEKSKSQGYKDSMDGLREEVTQFVGSGVESLVWKLLSSDEFHAALARVASLGINYGVERGTRGTKIVAASEGTLSDVAQIFLDKFVCSTTSVFIAPSSVNESPKQKVSP